LKVIFFLGGEGGNSVVERILNLLREERRVNMEKWI